MNPKNILTIIGAVMGLQSIGIFFGADAISEMAFKPLNADATGLAIGSIMHKVLATSTMMVAVVILSARNLEPAAGAKVLMGVGAGLTFILARGYYDLLATETKPPVPLLLIMTTLMILAFVTSQKFRER